MKKLRGGRAAAPKKKTRRIPVRIMGKIAYYVRVRD